MSGSERARFVHRDFGTRKQQRNESTTQEERKAGDDMYEQKRTLATHATWVHAMRFVADEAGRSSGL